MMSAQAESNPQLDAARFYHGCGWSVIPSHTVRRADDGSLACSCSLGAACVSKGKHPAMAWQPFQKERASLAMLEAWFTGPFKGYGIGLITGAVSGFFVVDVDQGPGKPGADTIRNLQIIHGDLPETPMALTGGGGIHYLMRHPGGDVTIVTARNVLGPGVDIRGDGGFIVAAPSLHASGRFYLWDEHAHPKTTPLAEAPAWVVEMATQAGSGGAGSGGAAGSAAPTGSGEIVRDGWGWVVDGRERHMIGVICGCIASHLKDCGLLPSVEEVFAEAWPTYSASTRARGASLEADHRGETLMRQRIGHMLRRAARGKWEIKPEGKGPDMSGNEEGMSKSDKPETPPAEFLATPFDPAELANLPRRKWVYAHFLIEGFVSVLGAPGGSGKTAYAYLVALAVVLFRELLGEKVHEQGSVWIYNLEDPRDELVRRMGAALQHHGISPADVQGKLFLDSGRDRPLIVAQINAKTGSVIASPIVPLLVAEIKRRKIKLFIVDPFIKSHRLNENDNAMIDAAATLWAEVAHQAGCAILLLHHFKKGGVAGEAASFRGASALIDASRAAITLATMTDQEADKLGIGEAERKAFVRIDNAKLNLAPPPTDTTWLRLVGVRLDNGDDVHTVERWTPPSAFGDTEMAGYVAALDQMAAGTPDGERYTPSKTGKGADRWAGQVLMKRLGKSPEQARVILRTWIETGVISVDKYTTKQRNRRDGIFVNADRVAEMRQAAGAKRDPGSEPS